MAAFLKIGTLYAGAVVAGCAAYRIPQCATILGKYHEAIGALYNEYYRTSPADMRIFRLIPPQITRLSRFIPPQIARVNWWAVCIRFGLTTFPCCLIGLALAPYLTYLIQAQISFLDVGVILTAALYTCERYCTHLMPPLIKTRTPDEPSNPPKKLPREVVDIIQLMSRSPTAVSTLSCYKPKFMAHDCEAYTYALETLDYWVNDQLNFHASNDPMHLAALCRATALRLAITDDTVEKKSLFNRAHWLEANVFPKIHDNPNMWVKTSILLLEKSLKKEIPRLLKPNSQHPFNILLWKLLTKPTEELSETLQTEKISQSMVSMTESWRRSKLKQLIKLSELHNALARHNKPDVTELVETSINAYLDKICRLASDGVTFRQHSWLSHPNYLTGLLRSAVLISRSNNPKLGDKIFAIASNNIKENLPENQAEGFSKQKATDLIDDARATVAPPPLRGPGAFFRAVKSRLPKDRNSPMQELNIAATILNHVPDLKKLTKDFVYSYDTNLVHILSFPC